MNGFEYTDILRKKDLGEFILDKYSKSFVYPIDAVNEWCKKNDVSSTSFFQNALMYTLAKVSKNNKVMIKVVGSGRFDSALKNTISCLAISFASSYEYPDGCSFIETTKGLANQITQSFAHTFDEGYFAESNTKYRVMFNCHAQYQADVMNLIRESTSKVVSKIIEIPIEKREYPIPIFIAVNLTNTGNYLLSTDIMKFYYTKEVADDFSNKLDEVIRTQLNLNKERYDNN